MAVLVVLSAAAGVGRASPPLSLAADERAWLDAHPVVRVGADFFAPVVFFEGPDGGLDGVAAAYLAAAADRLGVRFELVLRSHQGHQRIMQGLHRGQVDLVAAAMDDHPDLRQRRVVATSTYLEVPTGVVTRADAPDVDGIAALAGRRVAGVPPMRGRLRALGLDVPVEIVPPHLGVAGVASGRWDAYVGDLPTLTRFLAEQPATDLKVSAALPIPTRIVMLVRPEDAALARSLDRAFATIPPEEREAIRRRWFDDAPGEAQGIWPWLCGGAGAGLLVLGFGLIKVRRHMRRVHAIQATVESLDQHLLSAHLDGDARIVDVTHALCMATGFARLDLVGRSLGDIGVPAEPAEVSADGLMGIVRAGQAWAGEFTVCRKDGSLLWSHAVVSPRRRKGETVGFTVIWQDITERKRYRELSLCDELTGLFNRRCFNAEAPKRLAAARRDGAVFCLAAMDVDNFKAYNDTYGHAAGDRVLATVGGVLRQGLRRDGDMAFRLGGEEFVAVFAVSDEADASRITEDLRRRLQACAIVHAKDPSGVVTASFGVVVSGPDETRGVEALLAAADEALYLAKGRGRNRTVVASPGGIPAEATEGRPEAHGPADRPDGPAAAAPAPVRRSPSAVAE